MTWHNNGGKSKKLSDMQQRKRIIDILNDASYEKRNRKKLFLMKIRKILMFCIIDYGLWDTTEHEFEC